MARPSILRELREQRGETITSMAAKLEIGVSRYYMIESGARPASPELAEKIAAILGVETEHLFLPQSFTVREVEASA
jgi:transcriptional regulator with XRE-family HTH domain